ncbi:hypothetical protein [Salipiger bermudensis]|uniref:hypothetical protein n=1 Tax=Salipiger bermudensis TaxID=344736 RepID=UPI001A8F391D|nr:hypothetical protein [Salipiger bermudensis]MBN9674651.1 hypothetical protein [Salipiger bermudensis]
MAWYSAGTVSVTNGSATVTGSGTAWVANAQASEGIWLPDGRLYEIVSINSDTSLTISPNYLGTTQSGQVYRIVPVKGYPLLAAQQMAALISTVQGYVDGALSGRFGNGTVGAPGISFASNTAMGLYRVAANQLGFVTNGVRRVLLSTTEMRVDLPVTGSAVTSDDLDTTSGKLLRTGSGGVATATTMPPPGDDMNNFATSGFMQFTSDDINTPFPLGAGVNLMRFGLLTGQVAVERTNSALPKLAFRGSWDGVTFSDWMTAITDQDVQATPADTTADKLMRVGAFGLGTDAVWDYLVIADDGFGEFTPPRAGGLVSIMSFPVKGSGFPTLSESGVFLMDAGATNGIITLHAGANLDTDVAGGGSATGTSGSDGNLTIFLPQNGNLQIENRSGSSRAIRIGWL